MMSFFAGIALGVAVCGSAFLVFITGRKERADVDEWSEDYYHEPSFQSEPPPMATTHVLIRERKIEL